LADKMKLVLIPGLDGTGELFAPFLAELGRLSTLGRAGHPVMTIAYPPDREMDYAGHEAHVRSRLPEHEEFVLLAESFSGPVGISIAASPPSNLKGLILCASFASNPLPVFGPLSRLIAAFPAMKIPPALMSPLMFGRWGTPELRRALAATMGRVPARTLRSRVSAILAVDHSALLRKIAVPMLYLQASDDRLVPRSALEKLQRFRSDIPVIEIEGPHFLLQTQPGRCADAVTSFLGAQSRSD
jgi:pimeloyl-ACP methyl ester carboxylesterase